MKITGLHHVTAIAGDPQRNADFYAGTLGLHLVKRTVNFDDPGSYHLYYGDATGAPGSLLTFFPWPGARRGVRGSGEVEATAFAIPAGTTEHWLQRLREHSVSASTSTRFGEEVIRFPDPDGLPLELIAAHTASSDPSIRGLHSVSAALPETAETARLLTDVLGYQRVGETGSRTRFVAPGSPAVGGTLDLIATPGLRRGQAGAGSVHHIAFRAADAAEQLQWREKLIALGYHVSPVMDRTYFESIYFREPGGLLFEIATDPPGFAIDEPITELGRTLRLPPWMETVRPQIEAVLPKLNLPAAA